MTRQPVSGATRRVDVDAPGPPSNKHRWMVLAVVLLAAFMALLDTTILNVALPSIYEAFASETTLQWVVAGYASAFGLILVPAGRAGDTWGTRRVFLLGLSLFVVTSALCGLSQSGTQLVTSRILQGLSAGLFYPMIGASIQSEFTGAERGKAFGLFGATIGVSTAVGPLLGGLIISAAGSGTGWRWVFLVNLPIGVVGLVAAWRVLPRRSRPSRASAETLKGSRRTDWGGLLLLTSATIALLVPLIEGPVRSWPTWCILGLVVAIVAGSAFVAVERGRERAGRWVLVSPALLAQRAFGAGTLVSFVYFAAFTSIFFTISIVWQAGLGRSALATGLVITPFAVGTMVGGGLSDLVARRWGRHVLTLGGLLVAAGLATTIWLLHLESPAPSGLHLAVPFFAIGLGNGLFIAPNVDFVLSGVPRSQAGAANGVLVGAQRIGSAIGVAVIGTVLFQTLEFGDGPNAAAVAFIHSGIEACWVNLGLVVVALALTTGLPKRLRVD